jgi:predicted ATPase
MAAGRRRVVLVSGEAGIGKTALVDAFGAAARASGQLLMARGQCVPGVGGTEPYYPVMEVLGHLCACAEGEVVSKTLERAAPAWMAMLGRESSGADGAARGASGERMPGSLCAALEELSTSRPLMLIFEDLQWADIATLNLIAALSRRRAAAKLLVVATFRARGIAAGRPLKEFAHDLLMQQLGAEIALRPLGKTATMRMLGRELGMGTAPQRLGDFIHGHAEGNPMFAMMLLRHLIAQGFLVREESDGTANWKLTANFEEIDAGIPEELVQMVELEIGQLTSDEQSLLEAGSLMNVVFPAWAVGAALNKEAPETEEACNALAQRLYFVQRAGQDELPDGTHSAFYAFTHGMYREVLYQRQSAARRAQRHIRIAEKLGGLFAGREELVAREMAMHFEAAESWQRASQARRHAARYARERQAHAEAAELLEHALKRAEHLSAGETDEMRRELEQAREAMGTCGPAA